MLIKTLLSLPVLAAICAAAPAADTTSCLPRVTLASGVLVGTTTSLPSATATVHKFLSIPFAASPPERFSPPQDPPSWYGERNATRLPPSCIQQFNYPLIVQEFTEYLFNNPPPASESEDCLYLNVYVPATAKKGKAVLFWIYGGALQFGWSGSKYYDGSSFAANQDVIVVTTNYRTNVFGFSGSPEVPASERNSGFLDQRKALEWVQENIHAFGGNKHKVTIFGESAGGYSVKQLLAHPPSPLTYRAAIMQSEATDPGNATASWNTLIANLSCSDAPSPIACVRAVNATKIQQTIEHLELVFPPGSDGVTNSQDVAPLITNGSFAQVPFMIGIDSQEGRVFVVGQSNVTAALQTYFPGLSTIQAELKAEYANSSMTGYEIISDIFTKSVFQCPAMTLADLAVSRGNNYTNVWRYYYNASFPNLQPFPNLGVYHSSEIPIVFGTYSPTGATTQQIALSKTMQKMWANFAQHPSGGPGWPRVSSNGSEKTLGDLGGNNRSKEYTIASDLVDKPVCDILAPIFAYTGITWIWERKSEFLEYLKCFSDKQASVVRAKVGMFKNTYKQVPGTIGRSRA